jgi:hypothetical protein
MGISVVFPISLHVAWTQSIRLELPNFPVIPAGQPLLMAQNIIDNAAMSSGVELLAMVIARIWRSRLSTVP